MTEVNKIQKLSQQLATRLNLGVDGRELVETLKETAFKGQVSDGQMAALLIVAEQYGLNPWTKEIYAFPDKQNGIVPVVGVDGWSRIINSHNQFNGMEFKYSETMTTPQGGISPAHDWVECIVYRKDRDHPIIVREYLDEVYRAPFQGKGQNGAYTVNGPWQTHTKRMHRHKSMIQASRIAFGFVGIYDEDEAERIVQSKHAEKDINPVNPALQQKVTQYDIESLSNAAALAGVDIDYVCKKAQIEKIDDLLLARYAGAMNHLQSLAQGAAQ